MIRNSEDSQEGHTDLINSFIFVTYNKEISLYDGAFTFIIYRICTGWSKKNFGRFDGVLGPTELRKELN